jgi:hypothetical protein
VTGQELAPISEHFFDSSPDETLAGLAQVVAIQASRLDKLMAREEATDPDEEAKLKQRLSDQVDKNLNTLFRNGMALHKLRMKSGPPGGQKKSARDEGREGMALMANAIRELEAAGYERAAITAPMTRAYLAGGLPAAEKAARTGYDQASLERAKEVF